MPATSFPDRPIHLIAGASPGSASDILARALAPALSEQLRQPVTIESPQGDSASGAHLMPGRHAADGYTLFMATLHTLAIAPNLDPAPPYDAIRDFSPVSLVARCPLLLAVHPSVAARSVDELTTLARKQPGTLTFASSAIGGSPHLAAALYQKMANVHMRHVCYDRTRELFADLVAGRISLSFNNIMSMPALLSTGQLRGIAVTSATRSPVLPHLPTVAESGLDGYEVTNWLGIVAPTGVDADIIATLKKAIVAALQSDSMKQDLVACGMEIVGSSASGFARHIQSELEKWEPIVRNCIAGNAVRS